MSGNKRMPRLRDACNECHASKVKCSGEKTGCARCQSTGGVCRYEVSMVGRSSNKRQRKKSRNTLASSPGEATANDPGDATPQCQSRDPPLQLCVPTRTPGSPAINVAARDEGPIALPTPQPNGPSDYSMLRDFDLGMMGGNASFDIGGGAFDDIAAMFSSSADDLSNSSADNTTNKDLATSCDTSISCSSTIEPFSVTTLSPSLITFSLKAPSSAQENLSATTTLETSDAADLSHSRAGDLESHSDGVHALLNQYYSHITVIESHLRDSGKPIDELMQAGKTCARKLTALMRLGSSQQCFSCPMLAVTTVELITLLFETVSARIKSEVDGIMSAFDSEDVPPAPKSTRALHPSNLLLGSFSVDPEDAANIWEPLIVLELRRLLRLVDVVAGPCQHPPAALTSESPRQRRVTIHRGMYESLRQRINLLITSLQARI